MLKSVLRVATASVLMSAALTATAAKPTSQDFQVSGVIQEIPGPSPRCASQFGGTILVFGDSNVLGKVGFLSSDCITPNGATYTFSDGRFMITTLTGEMVFASYSGQFVPTGQGTNFVFSNASFQITGGTGRYHRASGGGDFTGSQELLTGTGTIKLNGKITYRE